MPPANPSSASEAGTGQGVWAQRLAFGVPFAVKALLTLWLIVAGRQVIGHDAFQYFTLQHFFLEQRAMGGEIAWWMPFMTHGTVSNWWLYVQAAPVSTALIATGWIPTHVPPLTLFHLGLFGMEALFLTGMWLLSTQYMKAPVARFFVLLAAATTTLWVDQIWYNLHQLWAIPLILYFVRRFLETGTAWKAGLAVHLLGIQGLGNMPYVLTFQALVVAAYAVFLLLVDRELRAGLPQKVLRWPVVVTVAFAAIVGLAPGYLLVEHGTKDLVMLNPGRQADGRVSLETFLSYGGHMGIGKWIETFTGVSPALDVKLGFGSCTWPLALFGILAGRRRAFPLAATLLLLFMLSGGSFPAHAIYYLWPLMKYFRHLGLMAPFVRPFLLVLAGIGLELLIAGRGGRRTIRLTGGLAFCAGVACTWLALDPGMARAVALNALHMRPAPGFEIGLPAGQHSLRLAISGLAAFAVAAVILSRSRLVSGRNVRLVVAGLIFVHVLDTTTYAVQHLLGRTVVLSRAALTSMAFEPDQFMGRRVVLESPGDPLLSSASLAGAGLRPPRLGAVPDIDAVHGMNYWSVYTFLRVDDAGSGFRVDHWLRPLDDLLLAAWGKDPGSEGERRGFVPMRGLKFPRVPWLNAVAGVSEDKIQFFSRADTFPGPLEVSRRMRQTSFQGDELLLYGPGAPRQGPSTEAGPGTRLHPAYRVERFDANTLELVVENERAGPIWLSYSDTWHPSWRASVNGHAVPIAVAQLAYKAVLLAPGRNHVRFHFEPDLLPQALRVAGASALFWLVLGCALAGRALWRPA